MTFAPIQFQRVNILGVGVSAIEMADALQFVDTTIAHSGKTYICVTGVHGLMESRRDTTLRAIHNDAGLVTPDGMPLVWIAHAMGQSNTRRVYGPDLMQSLTELSGQRGYRNFYYGGAEGVATRLADRLRAHCPALQIAGCYCPPYRALSPLEDDAIVATINDSGADIVWIGLSTPKQERWMAEHRDRLNAPVLIGVGAAFDFLSGIKPQAPKWMQSHGLEWLFRLVTEPRRLWRRYLLMITAFPILITGQFLRTATNHKSPLMSDR